MSIEKALEILKYDVRLIEYHLDNGMLTKAELEKHIKEIPDSAQFISLGTAVVSEEDEETEAEAEEAEETEETDLPQAH